MALSPADAAIDQFHTRPDSWVRRESLRPDHTFIPKWECKGYHEWTPPQASEPLTYSFESSEEMMVPDGGMALTRAGDNANKDVKETIDFTEVHRSVEMEYAFNRRAQQGIAHIGYDIHRDTNITLIVQDTAIIVNRQIIMSGSAFFEAALTMSCTESKSQTVIFDDIELPHMMFYLYLANRYFFDRLSKHSLPTYNDSPWAEELNEMETVVITRVGYRGVLEDEEYRIPKRDPAPYLASMILADRFVNGSLLCFCRQLLAQLFETYASSWSDLPSINLAGPDDPIMPLHRWFLDQFMDAHEWLTLGLEGDDDMREVVIGCTHHVVRNGQLWNARGTDMLDELRPLLQPYIARASSYNPARLKNKTKTSEVTAVNDSEAGVDKEHAAVKTEIGLEDLDESAEHSRKSSDQAFYEAWFTYARKGQRSFPEANWVKAYNLRRQNHFTRFSSEQRARRTLRLQAHMYIGGEVGNKAQGLTEEKRIAIDRRISEEIRRREQPADTSHAVGGNSDRSTQRNKRGDGETDKQNTSQARTTKDAEGSAPSNKSHRRQHQNADNPGGNRGGMRSRGRGRGHGGGGRGSGRGRGRGRGRGGPDRHDNTANDTASGASHDAYRCQDQNADSSGRDRGGMQSRGRGRERGGRGGRGSGRGGRQRHDNTANNSVSSASHDASGSFSPATRRAMEEWSEFPTSRNLEPAMASSVNANDGSGRTTSQNGDDPAPLLLVGRFWALDAIDGKW